MIVPRYDAGAPTRLTPLSDTEAFFSLALHAVNLLPHGAAGSEAVGRLAAQCSCYALTMSDLDEACAVVLELVGDDGARAGARGSGPWRLTGRAGSRCHGAATAPRRSSWTTTWLSTTTSGSSSSC